MKGGERIDPFVAHPRSNRLRGVLEPVLKAGPPVSLLAALVTSLLLPWD